MRALVYEGPWKITVHDCDQPEPTNGQTLLRIVATGICGSDLHGFTGENGRRQPGQVMGHESVAEVVSSVGESTFVAGDLVTFNPVLGCGVCPACVAGRTQHCLQKRIVGVAPAIIAAMAEHIVVPTANLVALPRETTPELGALVEPLAVGFHAAVRGDAAPGARALIIGAGPIGQAVALAARRLGAESLLVSEPDELRRALIGRLGFATTDPTAGDLAATVADELDGAPDLVFDTVGSSRSMHDALTVSSHRARVVLVGMENPKLEIDAYRVSTEERTLMGSFCYSTSEFSSTAAWVAEQGDALLPLIDHRVDLDGASDAFTSLAKGTLKASKVMIYPNGLPA